MTTTSFGADLPAHVGELDGRLCDLHAALAALDAERASADAERAHVEGGDDDAALLTAVTRVRTVKRRRDALEAEIADATAALLTAKRAVLLAEEAADAADREAVENTLASAAAALAAYETRLRDRWNRRNELGLPMPSRLDAIPGRRVHQMAARHFGPFGLASANEARRF